MKQKPDKRFGATAIEKGYISRSQLVEALSIQAIENVDCQTHRLLGEILIHLGSMTKAQVDDVLETMSNRIVCVIGAGR